MRSAKLVCAYRFLVRTVNLAHALPAVVVFKTVQRLKFAMKKSSSVCLSKTNVGVDMEASDLVLRVVA